MTQVLRRLKQTAKSSAQFIASRVGPHRLGSRAPRLWVLMYHRILPPDDVRFREEEPGMIVTPESFSQQVRLLKNIFTIISLSEWVERRQQGKPLPERACAITFDDGWRDNFEYAFPILQAEQAPATVFAVSHMIGTHQHFWPNRLAGLLRAGQREPLQRYPWLVQLPGYREKGELTRDEIAAIIAACKRHSDDFLQAQLTLMEQDVKTAESGEAPLMDWSQLLAMQSSGLVEIGSHTRYHCRLGGDLPGAALEQEIVGSRELLQQRLDKPVTLFCYPNGDTSPAATRLVREHYKAAVTTQRGINVRETSAQTLLRIGVHDDVSNTPTRFGARLSGWF